MEIGYVVSDWYRTVMAMTLRIDEELGQALDELAAMEGASKQEVIRRAVLERRDRTFRRDVVDRLAREALLEYSDAIERLGKE